jgi:hypothetical protein
MASPQADQIAELRQQIEDLETIGKIEAKLVDAKEKGKDDPDSDRYRKIKDELREARRAQRERRATAVNPESIDATAKVEEV